MPSSQGFTLRVCCSQLLPLLTISFCGPKKPSSPLDCHREDHPSLHLEPDIAHTPGCCFVPSLWTVKHCSGQLTCWGGLIWPWMVQSVLRVPGSRAMAFIEQMSLSIWLQGMLDVMMKCNYESDIRDSLFPRSHETQRTNEKQNQAKQLPDLVGHTCNPGLLRDGGRKIAKTNLV